MQISKAALEALKEEIEGGLEAGDDLIMAGTAGISRTKKAVEENYAFLAEFFSPAFLSDAMELDKTKGTEKNGAVSVEALARECGAHALYPLGEGGIYAGLWKMAESAGLGLEIDLRKIPIAQETVEISEKCGFHPYKADSGGALLIGIRNGSTLLAKLQSLEIPARRIGQAVEGSARLLYNESAVSYLEKYRPHAEIAQ